MMKLAPCLALFLLLTVSVEGALPYLEEILLGRCYYDPPFYPDSNLDATNCPLVVESFLDLLASHPDPTLQADDFFPFLEQVDFSFPSNVNDNKKKPMIWLKFLGEGVPPFPLPPDFVTPETTPGGKLMQDLVFCGAGQGENCNKETSRAYWKFWQAAYYEFTKSLHHHSSTGELTIVVEPHSDVQFLEHSIVPFFLGNTISEPAVPNTITKVTIYETEGNCEADNVQKLMHVLQVQKMQEVSCQEAIWELWDMKPEDKEQQEETTNEGDLTPTQVETWWLLVTYMSLLFMFYYCATEVISRTRENSRFQDIPVGEESPLLWKKKALYQDDDTVSGSTVASIPDPEGSVLTQEHFQIQ